MNDPKLAYEVFVKDGDNFVDRGGLGNFQALIGENKPAGVIFTEGPLWQSQRLTFREQFA